MDYTYPKGHHREIHIPYIPTLVRKFQNRKMSVLVFRKVKIFENFSVCVLQTRNAGKNFNVFLVKGFLVFHRIEQIFFQIEPVVLFEKFPVFKCAYQNLIPLVIYDYACIVGLAFSKYARVVAPL